MNIYLISTDQKDKKHAFMYFTDILNITFTTQIEAAQLVISNSNSAQSYLNPIRLKISYLAQFGH